MAVYEPLRTHSPGTVDAVRQSIELEDRSGGTGSEDHEPLLSEDDAQSTRTEIDPWAIACLLLQHASR